MLHVPPCMSWSSCCGPSIVFTLPVRMRSVLCHVVIVESYPCLGGVVIVESYSCLGGVAMASVGTPDHCWAFSSATALIFFARVGVCTIWIGIRGVCGLGAGIGAAAIECVRNAEAIYNLEYYVPFGIFWGFCSSFAVDILWSLHQKLKAGDSTHLEVPFGCQSHHLTVTGYEFKMN